MQAANQDMGSHSLNPTRPPQCVLFLGPLLTATGTGSPGPKNAPAPQTPAAHIPNPKNTHPHTTQRHALQQTPKCIKLEVPASKATPPPSPPQFCHSVTLLAPHTVGVGHSTASHPSPPTHPTGHAFHAASEHPGQAMSRAPPAYAHDPDHERQGLAHYKAEESP